MKHLINKNIKLRAIEPDDIDILYTWENNSEIWHLSNTLVPFSKNILRKYIENSHEDIFTSKQLRLIVENDKGEAVGLIDLFDFDFFNSRAGIGILIHDEKNRKKGFASEALSLLIDYCFEILQINQIYCNINTNNIASIKLFTNAGFEISGTKKMWNKTLNGFIDEHFLQLISA